MATVAVAVLLHLGALLLAADAALTETHHFSHGLSVTHSAMGVKEMSVRSSSSSGEGTAAAAAFSGDRPPAVDDDWSASGGIAARARSKELEVRGKHRGSLKLKPSKAISTLSANPIPGATVQSDSSNAADSSDATLSCFSPCVIVGGRCVRTNGTPC